MSPRIFLGLFYATLHANMIACSYFYYGYKYYGYKQLWIYL